MRLVAGFLRSALPGLAAMGLWAQAPATGQEKRLPWEVELSMPAWQSLGEDAARTTPEFLVPGKPLKDDLLVRVAPDGSLRVLDRRGVVRLKAGLPGLITKMWRDGGIPVDPLSAELRIPKTTPLSRGIAELPWGRGDLRPGLEGLLWILDDGERILTVLHPATARMQHLLLPTVIDPELVFFPGHLELREGRVEESGRSITRRWSLVWPALLPQFLRLARPAPESRRGTAFEPFPKE